MANKLFNWHKKVNSDFYEHSYGPGFNAGAESFGFRQKFANPLFLLTGTGYIPKQSISIDQGPQVYADQQQTVAGIGVPGGSPIYFSNLYNNDLTPAE